MVEGGRYNVENWTIVCMGATCTLTKIATSVSVSTKSIHLTLSRDDNFCSGGNESEGKTATCWVRVKWLHPDEQAAVDVNAPNTVEAKGIRNGSQVTVAHGGCATTSELYIVQGHDMVSIKFELRCE